jgi:hypothetical protein
MANSTGWPSGVRFGPPNPFVANRSRRGGEGVRRRFAGTAVGEEGGKPLWARNLSAVGPARSVRLGHQYFMDNKHYP